MTFIIVCFRVFPFPSLSVLLTISFNVSSLFYSYVILFISILYLFDFIALI